MMIPKANNKPMTTPTTYGLDKKALPLARFIGFEPTVWQVVFISRLRYWACTWAVKR